MMMCTPSVIKRLACLQQRFGFIRWHSSHTLIPLLSASPTRALIDETINIQAQFLPPHYPVTMRSRLKSEDGDQWEAFAHYNTNTEGTVNLSRDHSVGGSYLGCEPMGLFWGMEPAPGSRDGLRLRKKNVETPYMVDISLLEGHVTPNEKQRVELAAVAIERSYLAPEVKRIEIRDPVVGTLFLPPGHGRFPALLDLWGMGGGLHEYRSALFASRGYACLSLAYFGHSDLPGPQDSINVNDTYFKKAYHLLQDHPQVCSDRVGIIGLSFGVYLMLRIAIEIGVKSSCLIGINGPIGSTMPIPGSDGSDKPCASDMNHWTMDNEGYASFRDLSLPANMPPNRKVKVENLNCPLMYIVGEDDLSASSAENAALIEETLRDAGKSHLFTCLSYPGAGHLIEPPYTPNSRVSLWKVKPKKVFTQWGGQPQLHAAAQEDSWKRILDFMATHLRH